MALFAQKKAQLASKGVAPKVKMPEKDMQYFRDKIVGMAAAKRKPQVAGSNAQTTSYGNAMKSAMSSTQTYGKPESLIAKR